MASRIQLPALDAIFGAGCAQRLGESCDELAIRKPLVVGTASTPTRYANVLNALQGRPWSGFFEATAHSPAEVIEAATLRYREENCDGVVTVGGGSSISIGKSLAVNAGATYIALPTTYSGSEATAIYGRRVDGEKRTAIDERCRPRRILYDGSLSVGLPFYTSASSAANCMAHAVDALYAADAGPLTAALADELLTTVRNELPVLRDDPEALAVRERMLYAAFLGGCLVSMHGIALHHQLCHVIGGLYGTPHGANNAAVLPQAIAYNQGAVASADQVIGLVFPGEHPAIAVFDFLAEQLGDTALTAFAVPEDGASDIVDRQLAHGGYNPRPLDRRDLLTCVNAAILGERPD